MGRPLIFKAFILALTQLGDRRFRRVLWLGVLLTLALLVAVYAAFLWMIHALAGPEATLPILGEVRWLDDLLGWASFLLMLILSVFLMIPVASAIASLFLDDVAQAVEDLHYPALPSAQRVGIGEALRDAVNFLGVLILANVLALAIYMMFPPSAPLLFYGLNGFLLGREYFTLAAMRRIGRVGARKLRAEHRGTIWAAGVLMAVPLSIPVVNLLVPILGAATFTHIFHGVRGERL